LVCLSDNSTLKIYASGTDTIDFSELPISKLFAVSTESFGFGENVGTLYSFTPSDTLSFEETYTILEELIFVLYSYFVGKDTNVAIGSDFLSKDEISSILSSVVGKDTVNTLTCTVYGKDDEKVVLCNFLGKDEVYTISTNFSSRNL